MNYRDRAAALRIGGRDENGQQRTACGLDLVAETAVEAHTVAWVDWQGIEAACGFTRQERAVWRHCWRDGTQSTAMLGLVPHQVGAANREILRKLRASLPKLHPFLGNLDASEILVQNSWATARNQQNLGYLVRNIRMTIDELNQKTVTESAKLQRIQERCHAARVDLETAEFEVSRLERTLQIERENSVLQEIPWPTASAEKQFTAARAKVSTAQAGLDACMGALAKQAGIVEGIAGEITARRLEGFELALEPAKARAFSAMREFCEAAVELNVLANAHGIHSHQLAASLYPIGRDPLDGLAERLGRCDLLTHAIRFQTELWYRFRKVV